MLPGFFFYKKLYLNTPFVKDCSLFYNERNGQILTALKFSQAKYSLALYNTLDVSIPKVILKSIKERQAEFLAGRLSAKFALKNLTGHKHYCFDVGVGEFRQPLWPTNIVGSISHTSDTALAIVSKKSIEKTSIGIDIENICPMNIVDEVSSHVFDMNENTLLKNYGYSESQVFSLIFSAKESIFKSLFSHVNEYFGFEKAKLKSVDIKKYEMTFYLNEDFALRYQIPIKQTVSFSVYSEYVITYSHISK
ncbi:4'-phosphopantetheinyl transferase family protein [Vibrio tasmaniensis]|uniref:4'-phosphopantetheinyl transferase family protein n=1 Tax=Vibrio tasmaniensis TaxID=212663 RepID=UPI001119165E|nr:4'-phosphopantetheinyl transferase superfamily protein [Vibrio tasmaniensis]